MHKICGCKLTLSDTLWASGYEVFDRISEPYQKFLETLTAIYAQPAFQESAQRNNFQLYSAPRGAPENIGSDLRAEHPVIRTNPVTGWKSVFAVGHHAKQINGLTEDESKALLDWFVRLIVENHDLQVRHKWQNPNDLGKRYASITPSLEQGSPLILETTAIWDNRSVYHTATFDYDGFGSRTGQRAVSLGERPYLDPKSTSRREALAKS